MDENEFYWLRQPGPTGQLKGSTRLQKYPFISEQDVMEKAAFFPGDVICQYVKTDGKIGAWFVINQEKEPKRLPDVAPLPTNLAPTPQAQSQSLDFLMLKMEMDRLKDDRARSVDISWLQSENSRLQQELSNAQRDTMEKERASYARGRDDMRTELDDLPIDGGLNVKDLIPLISKMTPVIGPPAPAPAPPPTPVDDSGVKIRQIMALALSGDLTPEQVPSVILRLMGKAALSEISANRAQIFQAMAQDEDLLKMQNGKTPEIIQGLEKALQNAQ